MPVFKCTHIFQCGMFGWTESWYTQNYASLDSAKTSFNNLISQPRANLLGAPGTLQYIRVQDMGTPYTTYVQGVFRTSNLGAFNAFACDTISHCANITLILGLVKGFITGDKRPFLLRGLPDDKMFRDARNMNPFLTADCRAPMNAYFDALATGGFAPRILNKTLNFAGRRPVTLLAQDVGSGYAILTLGAHVFNVGDFVSVKQIGPKTLKSLNGVRRVVAKDATTITIPVPATGLPLNTYNGKGYVYPRNYVIPNWAGDWTFKNLTKRSTGRPLYLPVGHRKART